MQLPSQNLVDSSFATRWVHLHPLFSLDRRVFFSYTPKYFHSHIWFLSWRDIREHKLGYFHMKLIWKNICQEYVLFNG